MIRTTYLAKKIREVYFSSAIDRETLLVVGKREYVVTLQPDKIYIYSLLTPEEYSALSQTILPNCWRIEDSEGNNFAMVFERYDDVMGYNSKTFAQEIISQIKAIDNA